MSDKNINVVIIKIGNLLFPVWISKSDMNPNKNWAKLNAPKNVAYKELLLLFSLLGNKKINKEKNKNK